MPNNKHRRRNGVPPGYTDNRNTAVPAPPEPNRGKKRKRHGSGLNKLAFVLFAVILAYMVKYTIDFANGGNNISIESVAYGSIDIPNSFDGIAVRDEYVVNTDTTGVPTFNYGEGDKVAKNSIVATVSEGESAAAAKDKLKNIDESIIEAQKNRIDISIYKDDINRAEENMESSIYSAARNVTSGNTYAIYTMRNAVEAQLDIRTEIWITENSEGSDSSLSSQRKSYQSQFDSSVHAERATDSGILVLSCDGKEETYTPDTMEDISKKDIHDGSAVTYLSKTTAVDADSPLFKIIRSNNWYICAYIDTNIAAEWNVGDTKMLRALVDKSEKTVQATIESMTEKENSTYVVFACDRNVQDFMSVRTFEFYISDVSYVGLKVPNTAIVEKTFIKIPVDCVTTSLDQRSVIKRVDGNDSVVKLDVESSDENFVYVRQDFDQLKLGDVILKGTGETATEYTISEVSTKTGVLTANGAFAQFASISVLGKNGEYTIADANKSGLKAYDKIITNAADAAEGDEIY